MKKTLILSLLALGLTACHTMNRAPYSGDLGNYGFTYDLDGTPSPFVDTSYLPLTPYDLAAPIVIVVTNVPPPRVIQQTAPAIGETTYAGESPRSVAFSSPQIIEPSGADRGTSGASGPGGGGTGGGAGAAGGGGPTYLSAPGVSVFAQGGSLTNSNNVPTNNIPTNGIPTNNFPTNNFPTNNFPTNNFSTNAFPTNNFPTNDVPTNRPPFPTNAVPTNAFPGERTNQVGRTETPGGFTNRPGFNQNPNAPISSQPQFPSVNEPAGSEVPPPALVPNQQFQENPPQSGAQPIQEGTTPNPGQIQTPSAPTTPPASPAQPAPSTP